MPENQYKNRFSLRIDVDTSIGMREGLPRLLDMLDSLEIAATIYVVMGPDKNFSALVSRLGWARATYSIAQSRPALVVDDNPSVIERLKLGRHIVAPHGWDHQRYAMMNLTGDEKREEIDRALRKFHETFGRMASAYLFPADKMDDEAVAYLRKQGVMRVACNPRSFSTLDPFVREGTFFLPVFPFYDGDMLLRGDTAEDIRGLYVSYVDFCQKNEQTCSIAVHPCPSGIGGNDARVSALRNVLLHAKSRGFSFHTIDQLAELSKMP